MRHWFISDEDNDSILAMPRMLLWGLLATFCGLGIGGVAWWGPADWGALRIVLAGLLLGAMSFYMLFINRILVS